MADIIQAQDYYPFGSLMPGRIYEKAGNPKDYRFGFNGQEYTDELAGKGNHTTAQFWEYDARIGRRWNLDPKPDEAVSNYNVNKNSPLFYHDPNGDIPIAPIVWAIFTAMTVSAGVDYGTQVIVNKIDNNPNPYTDINPWSLGISGIAGGLTLGSSNAIGVLVKAPRLVKATTVLAEVTIQTGESVAKQITDPKNNDGVTIAKTFWDVTGAQAGGFIGDIVKTDLINIAPIQANADRLTRSAASSTRSLARVARQEAMASGARARLSVAKKANNFFTAYNLAKGEAFENLFQTTVDKTREYINKKSKPKS